MRLWAALWRSHNRLDGVTEHVIWGDGMPKLFRTRREARDFIDDTFGYMRQRPDLRSEPHGWRMPIPVRVQIAIK